MNRLQLEYPNGEFIAEKYEVVERLEKSPLGVSYRVRHSKSQRLLRLVLLDPETAGKDAKDRIIEAVKTAKAVVDPNLLKVGELGQHNGVAYVTMEDFAGRTLRELLAENKVKGSHFTFQEAAQITVKILEACRAVHDAGHTIRALRPEYVLINLRRTGPGGRNAVADVRIPAVGLWDLVPVGTLAEDEFNRGETQYLAPELKSFNPKTTPRADVYSSGVMFYELLVGSPPLGTFQLPRQRRPDLPDIVDSITERAMASAPEDRYPNVRDFMAAIQQTFRGPMEDEPVRATGVHPLLWVIGAVVVLGIGALLFMGGDPKDAAISADNALRNELREKSGSPVPFKDMILIPAGPFVLGRLHQESGVAGEPEAEVKELPAFLIDAFEYPNTPNAVPKSNVTATEAAKTCEQQGKRLCTSEEFEKACKGPSNQIFGYADRFDPARCATEGGKVYPSGSHAECKSGWGVLDIAGNLREWTSTPRGDGRNLVKGGTPAGQEQFARCAFSTDESAAFAEPNLGFRCCMNPPSK